MPQTHDDLQSLAQATGDTYRNVHISQIIAPLSYALDLTEGQPLGHTVRSCVLGMRIADGLTLAPVARAELYYSLLLKDAGCSSNASRMYQVLGSDERSAKHEVKTSDWTRVSIETLKYLRRHVRPDRPVRERLMAVLEMASKREEQSRELIATRCERGAYIARKMGFPEPVAEAILNLDEHWNGKGFPNHTRGDEIPLYAQIMNLAQTIEVYHALHGPAEALDVARRRGGRWFNPQLVDIALSWGEKAEVWEQIQSGRARGIVGDMAPDDALTVDEQHLDRICEAFADIIDAKSPFTYQHSLGVAHAAVAVGTEMGFDARQITVLRRASLLHDIGKLGVSNAILEKPGKLTEQEWVVIRKHPHYTQELLERAPIFRDFATMAAAHHEKLDGSGYHLSLQNEQMSLSARILAVSDIYDALAADRPYRKGMPVEKVLGIIDSDVPHKLDASCVETLKSVVLREKLQLPAPGVECLPGTECSVSTLDADLAVAARVF